MSGGEFPEKSNAGATPSHDLRVTIAGIELKNPIMTASGTFGYGEEFAPYVDLNRLGAIVVKGISREPKEGNPPPRIVETAAGMLNSIGLQNVGVDLFVKEKLPFLRGFDARVIVNFFGDSIEEYCEVASILSDVEGVDGLEMNVSCPNKQEGWLEFGTVAGADLQGHQRGEEEDPPASDCQTLPQRHRYSGYRQGGGGWGV